MIDRCWPEFGHTCASFRNDFGHNAICVPTPRRATLRRRRGGGGRAPGPPRRAAGARGPTPGAFAPGPRTAATPSATWPAAARAAGCRGARQDGTAHRAAERGVAARDGTPPSSRTELGQIWGATAIGSSRIRDESTHGASAQPYRFWPIRHSSRRWRGVVGAESAHQNRPGPGARAG